MPQRPAPTSLARTFLSEREMEILDRCARDKVPYLKPRNGLERHIMYRLHRRGLGKMRGGRYIPPSLPATAFPPDRRMTLTRLQWRSEASDEACIQAMRTLRAWNPCTPVVTLAVDAEGDVFTHGGSGYALALYDDAGAPLHFNEPCIRGVYQRTDKVARWVLSKQATVSC